MKISPTQLTQKVSAAYNKTKDALENAASKAASTPLADKAAAAQKGLKRALGNEAVTRATSNAKLSEAHGALSDKARLLQLRKSIGVSAATFAQLLKPNTPHEAINAKHAIRPYNIATGVRDESSLLHSQGIENRAAMLVKRETAKNSDLPLLPRVHNALVGETFAKIEGLGLSPEHEQVTKNLAEGLIRGLHVGSAEGQMPYAPGGANSAAKARMAQGDVLQRFGERTGNKLSVTAALARNGAAKAGNKTKQAANKATQKTYNAATAGVAGTALAAGAAVAGAALPLAAGGRWAWNGGKGVADGARALGKGIGKARQELREGRTEAAKATGKAYKESTRADVKALRNLVKPRNTGR